MIHMDYTTGRAHRQSPAPRAVSLANLLSMIEHGKTVNIYRDNKTAVAENVCVNDLMTALMLAAELPVQKVSSTEDGELMIVIGG